MWGPVEDVWCPSCNITLKLLIKRETCGYECCKCEVYLHCKTLHSIWLWKYADHSDQFTKSTSFLQTERTGCAEALLLFVHRTERLHNPDGSNLHTPESWIIFVGQNVLCYRILWNLKFPQRWV
jgi:hypothetical protein